MEKDGTVICKIAVSPTVLVQSVSDDDLVIFIDEIVRQSHSYEMEDAIFKIGVDALLKSLQDEYLSEDRFFEIDELIQKTYKKLRKARDTHSKLIGK